MDEMREIVTIEQVDRLFQWLAIISPPFGLLLGAAFGARHGKARRGAINGLLVGLLGPMNLALWALYNAITERLGLDRVVNLVVNIVIFAGLGAVMGFVFGYWSRRQERDGAPVGAPLRSAPTSRRGKEAKSSPENAEQ
jgi:hypothetical protein